MPVKTTEYAFIPQAVPLRISRSGYAARRKCLRPNPGPPKSEGLVLRIYTYDKCRRTDARNPMKKRVSVKKSSSFLLTKIKIKNHDAQFAGRPEGMHPGVDRPLPCPCGAFLQPAGTFHGMLTGTKAGSRGADAEEAEDDAPDSGRPLSAPGQASAGVFRASSRRSGGVLGAFRRASTGLPRVSAVPQASGAPSELRPGDRPRRSTEGIGTRAAPLPACTRPPGGPRRPLISTLQQHQCVTSGA